MDEKGEYDGNTGRYDSGSPTDRDVAKETVYTDRKTSAANEAAVIYGDEEAARLGYVARGLKSRHIQFIALGGTIGTGLFLGIGEALANYGPLSILLGYTITGIAIFCMMMSLGEMATWIPLPGAIPQYCGRYVDPAMGFAVGWNQWYSNALTQCAEISAAATLIAYWAPDINPAPWITLVIILIVCLNVFAVSIYGEAEFIFASVKIITILGLLLFCFIIFWGGGPTRDRLGFRYWQRPGAMPPTVLEGNAGRFLSFFSTLVNAAFSYGGVEAVAVAAGEAKNPRRNIPKAIRRVFWRILIFYFFGTLAIGVTVPHTDPGLTSGTDDARSSPWVIAVQNAQVPILPDIINAVILTSAASAGNAFLYNGSRYLFGLAQGGQAPHIFLKCTKTGVPIFCVAFTAIWSLLTYLSCGSSASTVFNWFLNLTTIANLFTWVSILIASIKFTQHMKVQGISRSELPFKAPLQPYIAYVALCFFAVIILFNGWEVFVDGSWAVEDFVTAYVGIPIYFAFYLFWKFKGVVYKRSWAARTRAVNSAEADLFTGKAAIDNEYWPPEIPKNALQKFWFWLA